MRSSIYSSREENEAANRKLAEAVKRELSNTSIDPPAGCVLVQPYGVEYAALITSYPYGRLRCLKRIWLERKGKHGVRIVEQTNDPKRAALVWNKPHAGTYSDGVIVLLSSTNADEQGHIQSREMTRYTASREGYEAGIEKVKAFRSRFVLALTPRDHEILDDIRDYCVRHDTAEKTPHPKTAAGTTCRTCLHYETSCTGQTANEGATSGIATSEKLAQV